MSDNTNSQTSISPEERSMPDISEEVVSVQKILKGAQKELENITDLAKTAKAAALEAAETQRLTAAALTDAQTKLADITVTATQVMVAKTQITDDQAVIGTKSDHIQKAQEHADTVRAGLDRTLTAATQQATEAEGQKSRAQSAADTITTLLTEIRTTKGSVETELATVVTARKTAEESAALTKGLADKSDSVNASIAAYEKRLRELDTQCANQLKTIESLLPGATSAGLAHAFNERCQTFLKPHNRWQVVFIGSILAIVGLTISGLWHVYQTEKIPTYDELARLWLARLPIAVALVWLALHASRESALAKRLEEDYGYKAAISSCFEGFRKQMSEIDKDAATASPLAKLCADTLTTIASPPGRIYDKHQLTVSPTGELTGIAKAMTDIVKMPKTSFS